MAIRNTNLGGTDYQNSGSTTLNGALNDSATTITVVATASFKSAGEIKIDSEVISYTGTTATTFTGCTRGAFGSTAASHSDTTAVSEIEIAEAADLNDTFDAAYNLAATQPAFWLNSNIYTVYDDMESYSIGAFTTNSLWNVSAGGSCASGDIGIDGTSKYIQVSNSRTGAGSGTETLTSLAITENKHTFFRFSASGSSPFNYTDTSVTVKLTGGSATTLVSTGGSNSLTETGEVLVVAKGSGVYDIYLNGRLEQEGITPTDNQLIFTCTSDSSGSGTPVVSTIAIDDVRESTETV